MGPLKLTRLAGDCTENGVCPAVDLSDTGTLVFTGPVVHDAVGLKVGPGEQAVELSIELVKEAMRALDDGRVLGQVP